MGLPAAKQGDQIVAMDIHIILQPQFSQPVPTFRSSPGKHGQ